MKSSLILKYLFLFFAGAIFTTVLTGFILQKTNIPQETLEKVLRYKVQSIFGENASIGKIKGNLFSEIEIYDIKIPTLTDTSSLFYARKVVINYQLLNIFLQKGKFSNVISNIQLVDSTLHISRDSNGHWTLIPKKSNSNTVNQYPQPKSTKFQIPFKGKIDIENLTVNYLDKRGWGLKAIESPFKEKLKSLNGSINFSESNSGHFSLKGTTNTEKGTVLLSGKINTKTLKYSLDFEFSKLNLDHWGYYILPFPGFVISDDFALVKGNIRQKTPSKYSKLPFWHDITITLYKADFSLPYLILPIENAQGQVHLYNGTIMPHHFTQNNPKIDSKKASTLIKVLQNTNIINDKGYRVENAKWKSKFLPKELSIYNPVIEKTIMAPPNQIDFNRVSATLSKIPMKGNGHISLSSQSILLNLRSSKSNVKLAKPLFPFAQNWKVDGSGYTKLTIDGPLINPKLKGNLKMKAPKLFGLEFQNMLIDYALIDNVFYYKVKHSELFNGVVKGEGKVSLSEITPVISSTINGNQLNFSPYFDSYSPSLNNQVTIDVKIEGPVDHLSISSYMNSKDLIISQQHINSISTSFDVENYTLSEFRSFLTFNNGEFPMVLNGKLASSNIFLIELEGDQIPIVDLDPTPNHSINGTLSIYGNILFKLDPIFWKNPLDNIHATINSSIYNYPLYGHQYDELILDFNAHNGVIQVENLIAEDENQLIEINGSLQGKTIQSLSVNLTNFDLTNSTLVRRSIPEFANPIGGKLTLSSEINRINLKGDTQLSNYTIRSVIQINKGLISGQRFDKFTGNLNWNSKQLVFNTAKLEHNESLLLFQGTHSQTASLYEVLPGSRINLEDFPVLLAPYGKFNGLIKGQATLENIMQEPSIGITFSGKKIESDFIQLTSIKGKLTYKNDALTISELDIKHPSGHYALNGKWGLKKSISTNKINYAFNLNIDHSDLKSLTHLIEGIKAEIDSRSTKGELLPEKVLNPNITIQNNSNKSLYTYSIENIISPDKTTSLFSTRSQNSISHYFNKIKSQSTQAAHTLNTTLEQYVGGTINGKITVKSSESIIPFITSNFTLNNTKLSFLTSEKSLISINPIKSGITYSVNLENGSFGSNYFDNFHSSGAMSSTGILKIDKTNINANNRQTNQILSGILPLGSLIDPKIPETPISLSVNLVGDDIGILSLFTKNLSNITNKGAFNLNLNGTLSSPNLTASKAYFKDANIYLTDNNFIQNALHISSSNILIQNNQFIIPKTVLKWSTEKGRTLKQAPPNTVSVQGELSLPEWDLKNTNDIQLGMDLTIDDNTINLNTPNFYIGEIALSNIKIMGPLTIPLSESAVKTLKSNVKTGVEKGPVISGNTTFQNGVLILESENQELVYPSLLLDMNLNLGKDLFIESNLLNVGILAGIVMDLEFKETDSPIYISGSQNAPIIHNGFAFKEGNLTIFDQYFDLADFDTQSLYKKSGSQDTQHENRLGFQLKQNEFGNQELVPILDLTAYTVIENTTTTNVSLTGTDDNSESTIITYTHLTVDIEGPLNNLSNLEFNEYTSSLDVPQSGQLEYINSYVLANTSEFTGSQSNTNTYDVLKILMPELVDGQLSDQFLENLGENRLNKYLKKGLLRPIEKQISKTIGIDDIQFDYDLGSELKDYIYNQSSDESKLLGINLRQRLSGNLLLRVKTNLELKAESGSSDEKLQNSEIELSYLPIKNRNLSLNYTNYQDESTGGDFKPKVSLRFSHEF